MMFIFELVIAMLALINLAVADAPSRRWTGSISARASHASLDRRQLEIGGFKLDGEDTAANAGGGQTQEGNGGGLTIGGLTLGGSKGGISGNGLSLPSGQNNGENQAGGNATAAAAKQGEGAIPTEGKVAKETAVSEAASPQETQAAPTGGQLIAEPATGAGAGIQNQPGRAEGEAAAEEAKEEAAAAKGEAGDAAEGETSNGIKATEESERFSEEVGITLNSDGNTANLGGNLGITQGSDGSKSVGGENGINVAADGTATAAGTETE